MQVGKSQKKYCKQKKKEKIKYLASRDSLTGLFQSKTYNQSLTESLEREQGEHLKAIDNPNVDNFKMVNDSLGHTFGDKLINEVAEN